MSRPPSSPNELSSQEKRALLEKLLKEKAAQGNGDQSLSDLSPLGTSQAQPGSAIQRLSRERKFFPLSSAQKRLWLLDQLDPGNPVYNISIVIRFNGNLNVSALEQSLVKIVDRHEILRANFTSLDGEPVQFLTSNHVGSLSVRDLTDMPLSSRLNKAEEFAEHEAKHSFDLSHEALVRANLFRLAEDAHLFQFVIHHIIFDGWSLNIFLQELAFFYTDLYKQEGALLPPLPLQYIDFAAWEANQLKEGFPEELINYWKMQLGSNPPVLEMPLDRPRPAIQSFRAGMVLFETPSSLT